MHHNNLKLCPRYHADEVNRKNFVEGLLAQNNIDSPTLSDGKSKLGQFSLDLFKVRPCTKKGNHNVKICDYYHHEKDRRRPTNIFSYIPPICPFVTRNNPCPHGDNCRYAHNKLEQLYHPERYKRKFCLHHPHNIHKCDYGGHCSFAHNETEIKIEILHNFKQDEYFYLNKYKTVFCPYIYEHDRNQCVYAHNPQDLRRDPNQYKYNAVQCPYWSQGQIYSYDEGGCPNQMECHNCHGWKELEYHPQYYRTKPCNNGKKCTKKDCPFYHNNMERRLMKVTSQLTQSLFSMKNNASSANNGRMFNGETSQFFDHETMRIPMEKKIEQNSQPSLSSMLFSLSPNESEGSRKVSKMLRFADSLPAANSLLTATNYTEEEAFAGMSYKPKAYTFDPQYGLVNSTGGISVNSDKGRYELPKNGYSQSHDPWFSFQPGFEDRHDDIFRHKPNKPRSETKANKSFDSIGSEDQNKPETSELTDDRFKKALKSNLIKKGLHHTIPYLLHPMIDLKALRAFTLKDFDIFPQMNNEEKHKIAKIIQEVLEGDTLLYEVNTITGEYQQPNSFSDDENLFKSIGLYGEKHEGSPSLASKLHINSH